MSDPTSPGEPPLWTLGYVSVAVRDPSAADLQQLQAQVDALNWAQTYGGPNLSQSELTQGVNLFNIFNGRTTGMLF